MKDMSKKLAGKYAPAALVIPFFLLIFLFTLGYGIGMISSMRDTRVPGTVMMKLFNRRLSVKRVHAIEQQIMTILNTAIHLTYDPHFPLSEGNSFRLFQIVYAVGPDTNEHMRQQIINAVPLLVDVLFAHQIDCYADTIAIRVRAHTPTSSPTWPHMFFEIFWDRNEFKKFRKRKDATIWHDYTRSCINHFDSNDPLHKEIRYVNHLTKEEKNPYTPKKHTKIS